MEWTPESVIMETLTEWTARRNYPELLDALGGVKPLHRDAMRTDSRSYPVLVSRFDELLEKTGVNEGDLQKEITRIFEREDRIDYIISLSWALVKRSGCTVNELAELLMNEFRQGETVWREALDKIGKK